MRPSQRPRFSLAAWLGIAALAIQALIPALLAAEIDIAGKERGASVFTLCAFGHLHAAPHDAGKDAPQSDEPSAPCPICIALIASPAFTAPPQIALPLPAVAGSVAPRIPAEHRLAASLAAASYRSRAPPIG